MDNNKTIFRSAMHFFSGTMISRFTGLLRDVLMAFAFGTNSSLASLMVAFRLSHLMRRLFGEGTMHAAFVPHYESLKQEDASKAIAFYNNLKKGLMLLLSSFIVLVSLVLSFLLFSFPENEILYLTLLLMPGLFFICLYSLNSSFLQCEKKFFIPSISPVAFNIIWIIGVICLSAFDGKQAAPWLALFIVFASLGQWLFTLPYSHQIINKLPFATNKFAVKEIKKILNPIILSIVGVAATQINSALDPLFAKFADSEGPAYLWYSIRLQQFPLGLIGIALGSALLPSLSRAYNGNDISNYKFFFQSAFQKILYFMIPISIALIFAGDTCVNLLYGHGDFGVISLRETTFSLCAYSVGILPSALIFILAPAFHAKKNYKIPMIFSVVSVLLNIILNSLFIFYFSWGTFSVALATSISAWVNCVGLYFCLSRKIGKIFSPYLFISFIKILAATFIALGSLFWIDYWLYQGNYLYNYFYTENSFELSKNLGEQMIKFIWEASAYGIPIVCLWFYEMKANINQEKLRV